MNIAKYVLENVAHEIVSILINGHGLDISQAYNALSESGLLWELEQSPYKILSTTYDDCIEYAEKIVRMENLKESQNIKKLENI